MSAEKIIRIIFHLIRKIAFPRKTKKFKFILLKVAKKA